MIDTEEIKSKIRPLQWPRAKELSDDIVWKLHEIARSKGYSSPTSRKALLYLKNRIFISEKNGSYTAFMLQNTNPEMMADIMAHIIQPVKTGKGTIYVSKVPGERDEYVCFTAHLFDRYAQRSGKTLTRRECVRTFMKEVLSGGFLRPDERDSTDGNRRMYLSNGLVLGERRGNIVLYKTYVSNDTLRPEQQRELGMTVDRILEFHKKGTELPYPVQKYIDQIAESD